MNTIRFEMKSFSAILMMSALAMTACGDDSGSDDGKSGSGGGGGNSNGGQCTEAEQCPKYDCSCADGTLVTNQTCTNNTCESAATGCSDRNQSLVNVCAAHGGVSGGTNNLPGSCTDWSQCPEFNCSCADGFPVASRSCTNNQCDGSTIGCTDATQSFVDFCADHGGI